MPPEHKPVLIKGFVMPKLPIYLLSGGCFNFGLKVGQLLQAPPFDLAPGGIERVFRSGCVGVPFLLEQYLLASAAAPS